MLSRFVCLITCQYGSIAAFFDRPYKKPSCIRLKLFGKRRFFAAGCPTEEYRRILSGEQPSRKGCCLAEKTGVCRLLCPLVYYRAWQNAIFLLKKSCKMLLTESGNIATIDSDEQMFRAMQTNEGGDRGAADTAAGTEIEPRPAPEEKAAEGAEAEPLDGSREDRMPGRRAGRLGQCGGCRGAQQESGTRAGWRTKRRRTRRTAR
mgnify:CR=1 FL=1